MDWTFDDIHRINDEIEEVALKEMSYNIYTNQVEVITAEQMLDAYASIGMPIFYNHWSFGKSFVKQRDLYNSSRSGLAYEIVINSDPCIVFIMEQNTLLMQTLVLAHAGIGHNHFFKNNSLFTDWTQASSIIDYLEFAKKFVRTCEEKYGVLEVEEILDAAHSLMNNGVFRYPHKEPLSFKKEMDRKIAKALDEEKSFNPIWDTIPKLKKGKEDISDLGKRQEKFKLPEENILYFLETYSPTLKTWQREILRIVRNVAQYFYPQSQTKIMNEGCATWTHYTILNRLHDKGIVTEGGMLEFLKSHTGVVFQPDFDSRYYRGLNPYALGFGMMQDICRICDTPTEEDREWFPAIAGCKDKFNVLKDAWSNYRDESFIRQFLSPRLMRDFRLFTIENDSRERHITVSKIHNERGYRKVRSTLADDSTLSNLYPSVEVWDVDMTGNRELQLQLKVYNGKGLHDKDANLTLKNIAKLWGYDVRLHTISDSGLPLVIYSQSPKNKPDLETHDFIDYCC